MFLREQPWTGTTYSAFTNGNIGAHHGGGGSQQGKRESSGLHDDECVRLDVNQAEGSEER